MDVHQHSTGNNKISAEMFIENEVEGWRSKMIKVYGDQHPYMLFVTAGHDFEDLMMKVDNNIDTPEKEIQTFQPFHNLENMAQVDESAVSEFNKILEELEKEKPTVELKKVLEEKKKECCTLFEMYDQIISLCEEYFELEYSNCRKRVAKQQNLEEMTLKEVEKYLTEIENVGNCELKSLRDRISNFVYGKGMSALKSVENRYSALDKEPLAMSVWFECSAELTSKEVRKAFLADQNELNLMWKKAYDDVLMLSTKLEKCRCNYNLTKFKLEREIFWMKRDYKENMPELTKMQRQLLNLKDQKSFLKFELKNLEIDLETEQKRWDDMQSKMLESIIKTKNSNKMAHKCSQMNFSNCIQVKKEEIFSYLSEILNGDKLIHEEILGVDWEPVDISNLKPKHEEKEKSYGEENLRKDSKNELSKKKSEDEFYDAFQILKSSENFMSLLNLVSDEMGCMLDFSWVDYTKKRLELTQDIKWIELFKVFKVNFAKDLKELKKHMMMYCKIDENGQVVFDVNSAVDGFLNFVCMKRHSPTQIEEKPEEFNSEDYKEYWRSAKAVIPNTMLWESVEDILSQYWKLLKTRSALLQKKFDLMSENREWEIYLKNFHKYSSC